MPGRYGMLKIIRKVWDKFTDFIAWATHTDRKLARDRPLKREQDIELAQTQNHTWRNLG